MGIVDSFLVPSAAVHRVHNTCLPLYWCLDLETAAQFALSGEAVVMIFGLAPWKATEAPSLEERWHLSLRHHVLVAVKNLPDETTAIRRWIEEISGQRVKVIEQALS